MSSYDMKGCTVKIKSLSISQLAKGLNVSHSTIEKYNDGWNSMPKEKVLKYIELVRSKIDDMIDWIDEVENYVQD